MVVFLVLHFMFHTFFAWFSVSIASVSRRHFSRACCPKMLVTVAPATTEQNAEINLITRKRMILEMLFRWLGRQILKAQMGFVLIFNGVCPIKDIVFLNELFCKLVVKKIMRCKRFYNYHVLSTINCPSNN